MSKQIDWTQPVSPEDKAWAEQFPSLHAGNLAMNAELYPPEDPDTLEGEGAEEVPYSDWGLADLQSETRRRNAEEGTNLKTTGTKADLAKQLEEDDVKRAM